MFVQMELRIRGGVARVRESHNNGILLGEDDAVLTPSTIEPHATVAAKPHLVAITLLPIVLGFQACELLFATIQTYRLHNLHRGGI